jgi:hypothetical protein
LFVKENGKRKALSRAWVGAVHQGRMRNKNEGAERKGLCFYAERTWWAQGPIFAFRNAPPFSLQTIATKNQFIFTPFYYPVIRIERCEEA